MHVVLFEPNAHGHRFAHVRRIAPSIAALPGVRLTLVTAAESLSTPQFAEQIAPIRDQMTIEASRSYPIGEGNTYLKAAAEGVLWTARTIRPDHLYVPYADGTIQIIGLLVVTALTAAFVFLRYRALLFSTFDPEVAAVSGVNVNRIEAALMIVLSLAILATLTVIGVTLVAAMLVIPAVIARMLTDSFGRMLWYSTAIGTVCGFVGMYASYYAGVPSGTMIVLVGATVFVIVLLITGGKGLRRSAGLDSHSEDLLAEPAA